MKKIETRLHPELGTITGTFRDAPVPGTRRPEAFYLMESVVGGHLWIGKDADLGIVGIDEDLAEELWPLLKAFAETGRLPEPRKDPT